MGYYHRSRVVQYHLLIWRDKMTQTFEEYLQEYVARTEPHTDDMLPEIYADWLEQVDVELIIELAEKWHQQEVQNAK